MSRFWQWWNSLSSGMREAILATIYGGLALSAIGTLWKFSGKLAIGAAKLVQHILNWWMPPQQKTLPPGEPNPPDESHRLRESTPTPMPDGTTLVPLPLIPKPPLVGFVARRDTEGHDILKRLTKELAAEKKQLIALCGHGGVGKTTLAAESVRALYKDFAGRVAWVSADGRPDFTLSTLLDEIAGQLHHPEVRPLPLDQKEEQLRALIALAPTLIVLDNFETIAEAERAHCADWLANRASCSAAITSRLEVPHARHVNISAMSIPEAQKFVKLLIAEAGRPQSFKGLKHDEIINAADRNPLVLQWIIKQIKRAKQPRTVLSELAQGKGDAAERVFGRSFNLLDDDGRDTLLALSLFVPSASRAALAEVAGFGEDASRLDAAAAQLTELWLANPTEGNKRLIVEGLTRELAQNLLSADTRADEFRERFIKYFQNYTETHAQPTPHDLNALEAEKSNLLGALDAAFTHGKSDSVIEMVYTLTFNVTGMLSIRGYWDEVIRYAKQGLDAAKKSNDEWFVGALANNLGSTFAEQGDYPSAKEHYELAVQIARKIGADQGLGATLHELGRLALTQGELDEARRLFDESLAIARRLDNQSSIARSLGELGTLAATRGELDEAQRLYAESLAISRRLGDQSDIATSLHNLANIARAQGELEKAKRLYNESLAISRELGDQSGIANTLLHLGVLAMGEEDKVEAVKSLRESLSIFERLKSPSAEIVQQYLEQLEGESS